MIPEYVGRKLSFLNVSITAICPEKSNIGKGFDGTNPLVTKITFSQHANGTLF